MFLKKTLIFCLLFSYSFAIMENDVYAQKRNKSTSAKKNKSKNKSKKSSRSSSSTKENNSTTTDFDTEEEYIETTTTYSEPMTQEVEETSVQQNTVANESTISEEKEETTTSSKKDVPDMSKEPEWEDFKMCMQQNCAGGDEQPLNVECYKSLNFENAFSVCKDYISDESKIKEFKKYFSGTFIMQEKKAFCEGEIWKGKFNNATGKCAITVTFNRNKVDGKHHGCAKVSKTKTWYLDNKNYICDGESVFNVSPCYHDSDQAEAAKMQKITATVSLVMGAATGAMTALSARSNYKETNETTDDKGNITKTVKTIQSGKDLDKDQKSFNSRATWSGIGEGFAAASGALTNGTTQLISASMMEKEKGRQEYGRCELPNGTMLSEGNSIKLSW